MLNRLRSNGRFHHSQQFLSIYEKRGIEALLQFLAPYVQGTLEAEVVEYQILHHHPDTRIPLDTQIDTPKQSDEDKRFIHSNPFVAKQLGISARSLNSVRYGNRSKFSEGVDWHKNGNSIFWSEEGLKALKAEYS